MARYDVMTYDDFEEVEVFEKPALFTQSRLDPSTIPAGYHLYELRHDDYERYAAQVACNIRVNFWGSIIVRDELVLPEDGFLDMDIYGVNYGAGDCRTMEEFMAAYGDKSLATDCELHEHHECQGAGDAGNNNPMYHEINETAARRAKEANSYNNYKTGSKTAEYRAMVDAAKEIVDRQKQRVDPMHHDKIDHLFHRYCTKLATNFNKGFEIDARVPSIMIAGPSNFPVGKKEKQNAARDRNMREYRDIQGILDKIKGVGMGGISADDPNAVAKLRSKLESLENSQATMKAVNAYYRKHGTLDGVPHLSEDARNKIQATMNDTRFGKQAQPFAPWALSNNNAEIRRLKKRIEDLERRDEDVAQGNAPQGWKFDGGEVVINTEANRLQILFDGKPDEGIRNELKQNGFRWTPSQGAWQRQYTVNAMLAIKRVKAVAPNPQPSPQLMDSQLDSPQRSSRNAHDER